MVLMKKAKEEKTTKKIWDCRVNDARLRLPLSGFREADLELGRLVSVVWCDYAGHQRIPLKDVERQEVSSFFGLCETVGRVVAVEPGVGFLLSTTTQSFDNEDNPDPEVDVMAFPFSYLGRISPLSHLGEVKNG